MTNRYQTYGHHFAYVPLRSVMQDVYFYELLTSKTDDVSKKYFIAEPNEITIKCENISDVGDVNIGVSFEDLLVVPMEQNAESTISIETSMLKNKKKLEPVLLSLIEDIYINNYFKEIGDIYPVKRALEAVPIIKAIICHHLQSSYYQLYLSAPPSSKKYYLDKYEDAYIVWSKFIRNPEFERLFNKGGWFFEKRNSGNLISSLWNSKYARDLDHQMIKSEKKYISTFFEKQKNKKGVVTDPINIRTIMKRYGILDVLKLSLPYNLTLIFKSLLFGLVLMILGDIIHFNLTHEDLPQVWIWIYIFLVLSFSIFTLLVGVLLLIRWKLRIIPGIFLPRLNIAILSGWAIFLSAEEFQKIDFDIGGVSAFFIFAVILFLTLTFMIFEINNYAPAMYWKRVVGRSLVVVALAFITSYTFGFWIMNHINKKFLAIDSFVVNESDAVRKADAIYQKYMSYFEFSEKFDELRTNKLEYINGVRIPLNKKINKESQMSEIEEFEKLLNIEFKKITQHDIDSNYISLLFSFNNKVLNVTNEVKEILLNDTDFIFYDRYISLKNDSLSRLKNNLIDTLNTRYHLFSNDIFLKILKKINLSI